MNKLFILSFLLLTTLSAYEQGNYLFVKKGIHKKATYMEGERIHLRLQNGENKKGIITQLRGETIFINGEPIVKHSIAAVVVNYKTQKPFPADFKTMLLIGGGVGLTTIGLSLNDANPPKTALIAAATIGYAPILLKHFGSRLLNIVKRTKYQIGHKFRLQVFDLYLPRQRPF